MKKITFILWITLLIISCTDHSTMVEVEGDSSSSALKLSSSTTAFSSSVIGLSSSDNFSSESLQSSSSVKFSSSAILSSSSSVISSSSSQYSSSSITQSSSSIIIVSSSSQCTNTYGTNTVTDCRDGQSYKTVMIGTQTWMAQNLNYTVDSSWCYNNSADSCAKYGRLYQWASAMNTDSDYNSKTWGGSDVNHQGICPDDWHLPSNDEWLTLYDYVEANNSSEGVGTSLKSSSGWASDGNGSDLFSLSALPGGYRSDNGSFSFASNIAYFWSATEDYSKNANNWYLYYSGNDFYDGSNGNKYYGFSIRCLKN